MSKPYFIEDYNGINNQLMAHGQRGHPCSEYIEFVGDDVRAGDLITFSSVTCSPTLSGEMKNTLLLHRQRQDITAAESAEASVAAAERLIQIE
jgi:hypothetical protein